MGSIGVTIGGVDYVEAPKTAVLASKYIVDAWHKLGRPQTPFSASGKKMMDLIIAVWEDCYPLDAKVFLAKRAEYKEAELSIHDQVSRRTGRSLASYPYPIYQIMRKVFKDFKPDERKNCLKMVQLWPLFRFVNKV